ncbi:MAG TPA: hypothetical protein VFE14_01725 [Micromonosporaceae bacterium]|jgi:hypothetical protein|nr:hypothetical protein [Micromonosporaceae bacterium]
MFDTISGMEQRRHWWNARWGRIARRDVYLRVDGDRWFVEAREGGSEGRSRWWELDSEDEALEVIRTLLAGSDDWRDL